MGRVADSQRPSRNIPNLNRKDFDNVISVVQTRCATACTRKPKMCQLVSSEFSASTFCT